MVKFELSAKGMLLIGAAALAAWAVVQVWAVVILVIVAFIFMAALLPYLEWLVRKGVPRAGAVAIILVAVLAIIGGLFSAVMIGLGRAVGETMIVLMAAGNTPIMSWNLFNGFQTLSAAIATELPEAARGSAHYRVLFLAALTLFAVTFVVNSVAEIVRQRFRRQAYEL